MSARKIQVVVRLRPPLFEETTISPSALQIDATKSSITLNNVKQNASCSRSTTNSSLKSYGFDQVYSHETTQEVFYRQTEIQKLIEATLEGFHSTIFAYGQTGSGKTYTMEGYEYHQHSNVRTSKQDPKINFDIPASREGVIPRVIQQMYQLADVSPVACEIKCSYVQIYNEQIYDLLSPDSKHSRHARTPGLKLRWTREREFYVPNCFTPLCLSASDMLSYFQRGAKNKIMSGHAMNASSSRSHGVFTIYVNQECPALGTGNNVTKGSEHNQRMRSRLTLVDLAGSERVSHTRASGQTLDESIGINQSLFVLRQVIQALAACVVQVQRPQQGIQHPDELRITPNNPSPTNPTGSDNPKPTHPTSGPNPKQPEQQLVRIPYRDSKLTSLLKQSLGGNSLTLMIACVSPNVHALEENHQTLEYATKTSLISNVCVKNEDPQTRVIRALRRTVSSLRQELDRAQAQVILLSSSGGGGGGTRLSESASSNQQPQQQQQVIGKEEAPHELKLKIIEHATMLKQMVQNERQLRDTCVSMEQSHEQLEHQNQELHQENQQLRERIEMVEYLLQTTSAEPKKSTPAVIPDYGTITTSVADVCPTSAVLPPLIRQPMPKLKKKNLRKPVPSLSLSSRRRKSPVLEKTAEDRLERQEASMVNHFSGGLSVEALQQLLSPSTLSSSTQKINRQL